MQKIISPINNFILVTAIFAVMVLKVVDGKQELPERYNIICFIGTKQ